MKFKVILSVVLFGLGLVYWSLKQCDTVFCQELTPFETFYGITGNSEETVDILKCLDEKSIQYASEHYSYASINETELKKACLEDWLYKEVDQQNLESKK